MSSESLAISRQSPGTELAKLAEEHMKHDLEQSDRDLLKSAATTLSRHAWVGSMVGLGLGLVLAYRLRRNRLQLFNAFKASEKPTELKFADGRTEHIPDITPLLQPTPLGDFATYFFFGVGGLFVGGEAGLLSGSAFATRQISRNADSRARIERAFRKFRADALRKEADYLDGGRGKIMGMPFIT